MTLGGLKTIKPSREQEGALARLLEVESTRSILRIEDAQGREVPATFRSVTGAGAVLVPDQPLGLDAGAGTHLVFILHDLRYKAATTVLAGGPDGLTVAIPQRIDLAERRRRTRGYLNIALLGLFSPLAAAAPAEPSSTFVYASVAEGRTEPSTPFKVDGLIRTSTAQPSNLVVTYMHDWMQSHPLSPTDHSATRFSPAPPPTPFRPKHRGPLSHGITYNFLNLSLPRGLSNAINMNSMRFESHFDRNNIRVGIRIK